MTLIGLCRQPFQVDDYLNDIVFKSITLHTVHGRRIFETWENCEKLVAEGMYTMYGFHDSTDIFVNPSFLPFCTQKAP